ncbi:MAG: flagellar L-ring protein precursor FlgH [Myxococcota bacterium]|jgi:flagellar L-ring protein precursor FlgH
MLWIFAVTAVLAQEPPPPAEAPRATSAPPLGVPSLPYPTSQSPGPGSLWVDSHSRMLSGLDGNARATGDLVTVLITESNRTSISAGTTTSSSSSNSAEIESLFGIGRKVTDANPNMGATIGMGAGSDFSFSGDGTTSRAGEVEAVLTCTVDQVLPNGNLYITGTKEVRTNAETQYVTLSGIIRPQDIQANNTIDSGRIANPSIQVHGQGVLADDQNTRIGTRVMKRVWPF